MNKGPPRPLLIVYTHIKGVIIVNLVYTLTLLRIGAANYLFYLHLHTILSRRLFIARVYQVDNYGVSPTLKSRTIFYNYLKCM